MRLEQSFAVPVPVEQAWSVLLDVERVAPCMPGATLTSFEGDRFTGTVKVKVGPVNLTYRGHGRFASTDEAERRVVIEASGQDSRSAGTAAATVTAQLLPDGAGTRVDVVTDLQITGRPAQFGRGLIADVSGKLLGQFAACLAEQLAAEPAVPAVEPAVPAVEPAVPAEPSPVDTVGAPPARAGGPAAAVTTEPVAAPELPAAAQPAPAGRKEPAARKEAEPVDLLAITGVTPAARRAVPYLLAFAAGAVLTWVVMRWVR